MSEPTDRPELVLRKCGYSRDPWRIGVESPDGRWRELAYLTFPLKRDALPILHALQALDAPWHLDGVHWPEALRQAAWALVQQAPGWQTWSAAVQRGQAGGGLGG